MKLLEKYIMIYPFYSMSTKFYLPLKSRIEMNGSNEWITLHRVTRNEWKIGDFFLWFSFSLFVVVIFILRSIIKNKRIVQQQRWRAQSRWYLPGAIMTMHLQGKILMLPPHPPPVRFPKRTERIITSLKMTGKSHWSLILFRTLLLNSFPLLLLLYFLVVTRHVWLLSEPK